MINRSKTFNRKLIASAMLSFMAVSVSGVLAADTSKIKLNIEQQPIGSALMELGELAGVQIVVPRDLGDSGRVSGINGEYTLASALAKMLTDTGLVYEFIADDSVVIKSQSDNSSDKSKMPKERSQIEEMVVTATKREVKVQDLSMSISAMGREEIERRGLVGMGDYLSSLPSVSVLDQAAGKTAIVIRGLAANPQLDGSNGATVGVYLGETPLSGFGIGGHNADIKMVDIERVEVLRGPQGTLYGSSTLGGTVRNIPVAPNLQEVEGKIKAGYSNTGGFGSGNSELQGVINIPLVEDKLAVRAVAYQFDNSGFYKNVAASDPDTVAASQLWGANVVNRGDVGSDEYTGARISVLWQPTDEFSVNLSYLDQKIDQDGWPQADLDLGAGNFLQRRLQMRHPVGAPDFGEPEFNETFSDDINITNATLNYDFGWASLLSSSSWINEESQHYRDIGSFFGYIPWSQPIDYATDAFIQEVRLTSQLDGAFQYLVGVYYEDVELSGSNWGLFGGDPALNPFATVINLLHGTWNNKVEQKAIFGEVSYDLTEQLKLTAGVRSYSYDKANLTENEATPFNPTGPTVFSESDESGNNYKLGIDYAIDDDTLLYASWSEGFRLGRPVPANLNPICDQDNDGFYDGSNGVTTGASQIDSDFVESYEIGGKFSFMDNRLQINSAIFQLNWDGLPIGVVFDFCSTTLNAGSAESKGFELEGTWYANDSLLVNFSTSYVKAKLTEDAVNLGQNGDRLPGSPEYNASLGLQYEFVVAGYDSYIRSDFSYVGGFYNNLQQTGPEIGDYTKLNVRGGIRFNDISLELFINNLTDDDAFTWVDAEGFAEYRANHLRPRTVGFNVGYQF